MQQPDEALYSLLCKYLLNEADKLERRWVDTWRKENAANEEALAAVRRVLDVPAPAVSYPGLDTASSWERLKERILQSTPPAMQQNGQPQSATEGGPASAQQQSEASSATQQNGQLQSATEGGPASAQEQNDAPPAMQQNGQPQSATEGGPASAQQQSEASSATQQQAAQSATGQNRPASARPQSEAPPRLHRYRWLQIAAALVLLAGFATWFTLQTRTSPVTFTGAQQAMLEDGSSVTMEPGAKLQLNTGFGDKERSVTFSGKAEFDIRQNAQAPFVILLGETVIKVLGTRFTVDFQPGSDALTVHVSNGRIQVTGPGNKSIILSQGMLLKRSEPQQPFEVAAHVQDIRKKSLAFRNVPLEEALQTLRAVYGISVNVEDSALLRTEITTNFENESIENIMETIAFMTNTKVERTGEQRFSIR